MDLVQRVMGTLRVRHRNNARSPAPQGTRDRDAPNQILRATIDQINREPVGTDPKDAFTSKIWPNLREEYDNMREGLEELCKTALKNKAIKCQVESRTKATDSIKASLDRRENALWERNKKRFESFSDIFSEIHDLVGVRIILEYPDDMEKVIHFIKESFLEYREPAIFRPDRKVGRFWKTWFGAYQTINYRLSLEDGKFETLSRYCGVLFEIQLTTIAENLYNKFAHPLLHKDSFEPLTPQDEIVIDMSHGISLCYALCLMYMKDKIGKGSGKIKHKNELVAATTSFQQSLTKAASFDAFSIPEDLATAVDIPPGAYRSAGDLREWIDGRITDILTEVRSTSQTIRGTILSRLPVAEGAAFDSHAEEHNARCHPDTRAELLSQIRKWANNPQTESIFWLNGMAGTGKSTVSRTVASSFAADGLLGASFFFKRGEGDRGKATAVFPTIASQLSCNIPIVAPFVKKAIDDDPAISGKALREQFEKLILQPLGCIHHNTAIVIVIDALDECDGDNNVKTIISLLPQANAVCSPRLRVLITSRPELPIRLGFRDLQGKYQGLALHQIPEPIVEHDISTFLGYELARIRDGYNYEALEGLQLPPSWPTEDIIRDLTQMAVPLFIFAATVCRFIEDKGRINPTKRLNTVLQYRTATQNSSLDKLDATYLPVLDQLVSGRTGQDRANSLAEFRDIVGPIVLLSQPLSVRSLAGLLNIKAKDIHDQLKSLHSVLDIPSQINAPVRLFHLSFRDFLVDPAKRTKNDFWIDEIKYHKTLADSCIRLMQHYLRRDICNLQVPGTLRSDIHQQTIDNNMPPELQYACQYWIYHLKESRVSVQDGGSVHTFLIGHLLHWLEALGLLGRISETIGMVDDMLYLVDPTDAVEVYALLRDIKRVILSNRSTLDIAPLQIYISALIFSPARSITRKVFKHEEPEWIVSGPNVEDDWSACWQTLEGHGSSVRSVALSPDSKLIASGSSDETVKLWDAVTGAYRQTLKGHSGWVNSVVFSPDSKLVVSGSSDKTVKLWDATTGANKQTLKGHSNWVISVAYSPDAKLIASASYDKTVKLWDAITGAYRQTLDGHSGWVNSVAFSPDLMLIASASEDKTVKLWNTATGTYRYTLEGHSDSVHSVTFSPDSKLIVSASSDKTVMLWDAATRACRATLEGHSDLINSVAFSPDSKLITSASSDKTVKLWDAATGACKQTFEGHTNSVHSVAFSPDSKLIASASENKTVKLWDATTYAYRQALEGHSELVYSVALSPDSKLIASASYDQTVKLWDAITGAYRQTLDGHSGWVSSVAFSPDSKLIVSGSFDKTIKVWDAVTGDCRKTLDGHSGSVNTVIFSPHSKIIASGSSDNTIKLWDAATGDCRKTLSGHSSWVNSIVFSTDSKLIASTSEDNTIKLWDILTGTYKQTLHGHSNSVLSVAISPDLKLIASTSRDKTVKLWDTATGACTQTHNIGYTCHKISFNSIGSYLCTNSGPIDLGGMSTTYTAAPTNATQDLCRQDYGISQDGMWITRRSQNWVWLPPGYREQCSLVTGSMIVIGCTSGRVVIMTFSTEK